MKWELTYLGTQVAVVAASDEAYGILSRHGLETWTSGGCSVLAAALEKAVDGRPYALVRGDGVVDHIVSRVGDAYIDADGAYSGPGVRSKHEALEGHRVRLVALESAVIDGISCPIEAVRSMEGLLKDRVE